MNIKSQKAKELIEYGKFSYDEIEAYVLPESYVETIIVQAEQDAEERAINTFKAWCKDANPYFYKTSGGKNAIEKFKKIYDENNE